MGFPPSGGGTGGYTQISQATPSGAATISFSGLTPTSYTFFLVTWQLVTSNAADQDLRVQVNGDSTAGHYQWIRLDSTANSSSASDSAASVGWVPTSGNSFGSGQVMIPAQHGGSTRCGHGIYGQTGSTANRCGVSNAVYSFNIAANVTSITLFAAAGNLTGNATLWGVP